MLSIDGPVFRSTIENVAADIGTEVSLNCDVEGNPQPDTVWTFEGSDAILSTDPRLLIPQLTLDKAGKYTCRATVAGFAEISTNVLVFIKGKQTILKKKFLHYPYSFVVVSQP